MFYEKLGLKARAKRVCDEVSTIRPLIPQKKSGCKGRGSKRSEKDTGGDSSMPHFLCRRIDSSFSLSEIGASSEDKNNAAAGIEKDFESNQGNT